MGVPELDGCVLAPAGNGLAIGRKRDRINFECVPLHDMTYRTCFHIPEPHGSVLAAGGQQLAVWRERDAFQTAFMPFEDAFQLAGLAIPDAGRLIRACTHKQTAIEI